MNQYFTNNKDIKEDIQRKEVLVKDTVFNFYTDNGVFNKKGLDFGTRLLLENFDFSNKNSFLDMGCGCGPIGIYIAKHSTSYTVDMIDVNERAINLTKMGIKSNNLNNCFPFISNGYENIEKKYDTILTNPPIHAGKKIVYDIIGNAYKYLTNNGELWIVIRKDQGANSLLKDMKDIYNITVIKKSKGFCIFQFKPIDKTIN